MPIVIQPKILVTLSEFLASNGLTLLVRENGDSVWECNFEPEVLEFEGEDDEGEDVFAPVTIVGDTSDEAVAHLCEFLSGNEDLYIDGELPDDLISLDLHYTRVEGDLEKDPA